MGESFVERASAASLTSKNDGPGVVSPQGRLTLVDRAIDSPSETIAKKPLRYRAIKRLFDIVVSALVIVIGFIPGAILSIAIVKSTGGSPLYRQVRLGKDGRHFNIYKFRTMVADSDNVEKYLAPDQLNTWKLERKVDDDPRVTPLGGWLRRHSIDEFPNFINVFLGQMSVIGPRAMVDDELKWFGTKKDLVLSVPSGVTGWWQVSARNDATFDSGLRQRLELYYARNASLGLDIKIFFRTFVSILGGTGK